MPLAILGGAALAFFALIGFEDSVNVAEETKEPSRIFPSALFIGLARRGRDLPAGDGDRVDGGADRRACGVDGALLVVVDQGPLGMSTKVFSAIALFALTNGALINLIMASRLVYGMSRQGIVPRGVRAGARGRQTPWVAIVFTARWRPSLVVSATSTRWRTPRCCCCCSCSSS